MKRSLLLLFLFILVVSLLGCNSSKAMDEFNTMESQEIVADSIFNIEDYYPIKENTVMECEGIGNEFAEKKTFVEFIQEKKVQIKEMNPGTTFVRVIEYKDGELREIFAEGEFYHIENMLNTNTNRNNVLLKEPLVVGNSWTNDDGSRREITELNKRIEIPSGLYDALEVTTEFQTGSTQVEYFVRGIGLVASIYKDGEFEVKTLLKTIENKEQEMNIISYYPTAKDIGTAYVEQNIKFGTNDNIEEILEKLFKNPPSDKLISPISKETKINGIHLDRESWVLEVDFSKEFADNLNTGSAFEVEMLKSIVNTLGKFYDVDKVYITVEGVPYESGHFSIREGEYFIVDTTELIEIQ